MIARPESQVLCAPPAPMVAALTSSLQLSALKLATLRKNPHKRAKSRWLPSARRPGLCFQGKWIREWSWTSRI